jgi:hypothetical protein
MLQYTFPKTLLWLCHHQVMIVGHYITIRKLLVQFSTYDTNENHHIEDLVEHKIIS